MLRTFAGTTIAVLLLVAPQAQTATTIRVWKVGSPHTGNTPHTRIPPTLAREIRSRGWRLTVTAFPAEGFARRFFAARREGSAPDLLVFDNFGIMDGITTELGSFNGVGQDPVVRKQFIQVTGSFDELLVSPPRGWTFLLLARRATRLRAIWRSGRRSVDVCRQRGVSLGTFRFQELPQLTWPATTPASYLTPIPSGSQFPD